MSNSELAIFKPVTINQWKLRNRIVMAPLTRGLQEMRTEQ